MGFFGNNELKQEAELMQREQERRDRINVQEELQYDVGQSQLYDSLEEPNENIINITLSNASIIYEIENTLRGRIQTANKEGVLVWAKIAAPVMNDEGIQATLQVLSGCISKNTILANLERQEVNRLMQFMYGGLVQLFAFNSKRFELDSGRRSIILRQISTMIYQAMTRSVDAAERKDVYGRTKSFEHRQLQEAMRKKGNFNIFGGQ